MRDLSILGCVLCRYACGLVPSLALGWDGAEGDPASSPRHEHRGRDSWLCLVTNTKTAKNRSLCPTRYSSTPVPGVLLVAVLWSTHLTERKHKQRINDERGDTTAHHPVQIRKLALSTAQSMQAAVGFVEMFPDAC
jgi:hypothetical protein